MFLNTLNDDEMYKSVSQILQVEDYVLREYIKTNADDIVGYHYDDSSIDYLNFNELLELCNYKIADISYVTVNHITLRKDSLNILQEGIMTLPHALTSETSLSLYLKGKGFSFDFVNNKILMKCNGELVDVRKLGEPSLIMRFGGEGTTNDFNVNGYLFARPIEIDFCKNWINSPEILRSLSNAYSDYSIAQDYAHNCTNYMVSFDVPINQLDIEGFDPDISIQRKTKLLLKYTLNALAYTSLNCRPFLEMYNPIIMLKRDYDVPSDSIRKIWKLKFDKNNVVPVP